jgi:hypothetical protein
MVRLFLVLCLATTAASATASIEYDQVVAPDVIFGSGNANGGFTTDRASGLELGLRAKVRFPTPLNQFGSNGDGTYSHLAGNDAGRPLWSFEWSINTSWDGTTSLRFLRDLVYALRIDTDPSAATSFLTFDPINDANPITGYWDHAIGDQFTGNGGGTVSGDQTLYNGLIATKPVAQNSWRMDFFPITFDPNTSGNYTFELAAFAKGSTTQSPIAVTSIQVIVENGAVPEPFSILVWGSLIVGAMVASRRIQRS